MTMQRPPVSEESLNALVDGEYSPEEGAALLARVRADARLSRQAAELRMLKDTVRLAYREVPPPRRRERSTARRGLWRSVAAGLGMLMLGLLLGWGLGSAPSGDRFVILDPDGRGQAPAAAHAQETRIVFHLTNPDMTVAGDLLNEVEALLAQYEQAQSPLRVEVVAHGEGLGLLRAKLSAYKDRVHALAERFPNLTFVACKNTIDRLRVERGVEVVLLPEARLTPSGVEHVVRRQQEGWVYIRV